MLKYDLDRYKTPNMCKKFVHADLLILIYVSDLLVRPKMFEVLDIDNDFDFADIC